MTDSDGMSVHSLTGGSPYPSGCRTMVLLVSWQISRHFISHRMQFGDGHIYLDVNLSKLFAQASQLAGEARQKRVREGAGLTGSARLAGAPRICLSPHFSRCGIWTWTSAQAELTLIDNYTRWKYVNRYVSTPLLRSQHNKHHNCDPEPAHARKTAHPKGSSLTFVPLQ